jgi:hypothetical protein
VRETGDLDEFLRGFREHLDRQADPLRRLARLAGKRRVCLLCLERDASQCHRREVAARVGEALGGEIRHL